MEGEYAKSNLKTLLSLIWGICELLPFVRVGQYYPAVAELPHKRSKALEGINSYRLSIGRLVIRTTFMDDCHQIFFF